MVGSRGGGGDTPPQTTPHHTTPLALGRHGRRAPGNHKAAVAAGNAAPLAHAALPVRLGAEGLGDNVLVEAPVAREARRLGQLRPLAAALGQTTDAVAMPAPRGRVVHAGTGKGVRQLVQQRQVDLVPRHLAQRRLVDLDEDARLVFAPAAAPLKQQS